MRPLSSELANFLSGYSPHVRALALRARALILKALPDATETVWTGWRMIGYGRAPGMPEMIYGIAPLKARINLTFTNGTALEDPHGLLKGTSRTGRHLHVSTIEELESLPVRGLIKQALAVHADAAGTRPARGRARADMGPVARKPRGERAVTTQDEGPVSDATVKDKTGRSWNEWFRLLDRAGAARMSHPQIVRLLADEYDVGPWWRQMLTVGYERARGLREKHETLTGYQVGASRTIEVPLDVLWAAWHDARRRRAWLGDAQFTIRKATPHKSLRITWNDGSSVDVLFQGKGASKSSVSVDHRKLTDGKAVEQMRAFWKERLGMLKQRLER